MDDFEARAIPHGAFKAGVLVAADDERIKAIALHRLAQRAVPPLNLAGAGQLPGSFALATPQMRAAVSA